MRAPKWITNLKRQVELGHRHQKYGDQPYMYHIWDVVEETKAILSARGIGEDHPEYWNYIGVSMAHDLKEDCGVKDSTLYAIGCPDVVVVGINCMTKLKGETRQYYIMNRVLSNKYSHVSKQADSLCNLKQSIRENALQRILKYTDNLRMMAVEVHYGT